MSSGLPTDESATEKDAVTPTAAKDDERVLAFTHRERQFELRVRPGEYLALVLNGIVRKERVFAGREPLYVWTNVELEWEEHHYIEVRYWPGQGTIEATVNGAPLHSWQL